MSTERELVEKFKEAFETRNIDKFSPYLTEDMTYEILPPSVGRKVAKAEWTGEVTGMFAALQSVKLELTNVIEHPLFIVAQGNVTLTFPLGPFNQEVLLLFNFVKHEGGPLMIASIVEYMDSFKVKEWKGKLGAAGHLPNPS